MSRVIVKQLHGRGIEVPCQNTTDDDGPIPAKELFPVRNPNVLLLARKQSGKTTILYNITKAYVRDLGKDKLKVIIYSPSWNKNNVWKAITKHLDENEIDWTAEDYFKGVDANNKKFNHIDQFNRKMGEGGRPESTYLMLFDDLGSDMTCPKLTNLLSKNRQYNLVICTCVHDVPDAKPKALNNYDYIFMFPNITDTRILELHRKLSPALGKDAFLKLYQSATERPYNFLYFGNEPERYRYNFDRMIEFGE